MVNHMPGSQFSTPLVSGEASLLRQSQFWIVQLAGWLIINLFFFWVYIPKAATEVPGLGPELVTGTSCVMSIAGSTALAIAYLRMRPRWLNGVRAIAAVLGLSLLAVLPWTTAINLVERATYPFELGHSFGFGHFLDSWLLMVWWSVAFLWFAPGDQRQEPQTAVRSSAAPALKADPSAPTQTDGQLAEVQSVIPSSATERGPVRWGLEDRVSLQERTRVRFCLVRDIACIRAAAEYTEVHLSNGDVAMVMQRLRHWEVRLPECFVRIHRSTLINLELTEELVHVDGAWRVRLRGCPEPVTVSRRLVQALKARVAEATGSEP